MEKVISQYQPLDNFTDHSYDGLSAVNGLIVDGAYLDGSWELCINVEDITSEVIIRVRGDMSLGGLMHLIVETVNVKQSWSDHAIWWPQKNLWLLHTRTSLDQYGVQSDARLFFRRTHGNLQIVLPSLMTTILRVNYASRVFSVVESICKELCIRHPEELSLMFPVKSEHLKMNSPFPSIRHGSKKSGPLTAMGSARSDLSSSKSQLNGAVSMDRLNSDNTSCTYPTLPYGSATLTRLPSHNSLDGERLDVAKFADPNQRRSAREVFLNDWLLKPKNLQQKARLEGSWLDSSRSLMEHGIEPPLISYNNTDYSKPPSLYLKFKFYNFYDLNLNYDSVRIHQLFEQARWSLLSGCLDCTEDEMIVFAAYQLNAEVKTDAVTEFNSQILLSRSGTLPRYSTIGSPNGYNTMGSFYDVGGVRSMTQDFNLNTRVLSPHSFGGSLLRLPSLGTVSLTRPMTPITNSRDFLNYSGNVETDEIDALLAELEQSCNVSAPRKKFKSQPSFQTTDNSVESGIPILQDSIKIVQDRVILLRRFKDVWAIVENGRLTLFRDSNSTRSALAVYPLRDCSISPDMSSTHMRFDIKLSLIIDRNFPSSSPSSVERRGKSREEVCIRFNTAEQYATWVAAFRLIGCGKPISRASYDEETEIILNLVRKKKSNQPALPSSSDINSRLSDLSDYCMEHTIKKSKSKDSLRQRIIETYIGVHDLNFLESQLRYIRDWQRLNNFGRSYFIVQFEKGSDFGLGYSNSGLFSNSSETEDVIAVRQGCIEVVSPNTEEVKISWNFTDLRSWNVNWDNGTVILEFRAGKVSFKPLSANCKTVMEFIGGYVFLSQRTPEKNQKIDERIFHKLSGAGD